MNIKQAASFATAIVSLFLALTGYVFSLDRRVEAKLSEDRVRQLIDDKTSDKFFEVFRRFDRLEAKLDKVDEAITGRVNKLEKQR